MSSVAIAVQRLASRRIWVTSAVLFTVFAVGLFGSSFSFSIAEVQARCGQVPLDVRAFSTAADVEGFLDACGTTGREAYRHLQIADLFYPLVFGVFLASSLVLALRRLAPHRPNVPALAVVALLAAGFDYLENVFAWRALAEFPEPAATSALLGYASAAKTITSWTAVLLLVGSIVALVVRASMRGARRLVIDRHHAISH